METGPGARSPKFDVWASLPVFLFAIYPLSIVLGANAGASPLDPIIIVRCVIAAIVLSAALLLALRFVIRDFAARAIWLSWVLLLMDGYAFALKAGRQLGAVFQPESAPVAATYTLASLAVATLVVRPWRSRRRDRVPLNIAAAALIAVNAYLGVSRMAASPASAWRPAADALVAAGLSRRVGPDAGQKRDVYYIVLDGFGRPDMLRRYYGLDLERFTGFLRSKRFYVPDQAHSNYSQTFLSLSSALNMGYLDEVAARLGKNSPDLRPLHYLIQENALMKAARRAGYRVIGIGSDTDTTSRLDGADVCLCRQFGFDMIEQAAIAATPFGALPLDRWTLDAHRRKILESFRSLEETRSSSPQFVFAHILAPHPPFVLGPGGAARRPRVGLFMFNDGDLFNGPMEDYVAGYRDQAQFLAERLTVLVETLLSRPGPAPVVVIHGDHGPGSMLRWEDAAATNQAERMSIFAAYLFPESGLALYPTMTPINGARALASQYFGADLPLVADKSAFSTLSHPYDLVPASLPASASTSAAPRR